MERSELRFGSQPTANPGVPKLPAQQSFMEPPDYCCGLRGASCVLDKYTFKFKFDDGRFSPTPTLLN